MRDRDVAKRKAIKSNNPQDWAMYKRLRNRINGEVKSTTASYYGSAFIQSNGDSRKTWQLINELTSLQKNNASVKELKLKKKKERKDSNIYHCKSMIIIIKAKLTRKMLTDIAAMVNDLLSSFSKARKIKWPSFLLTKGSTLLKRKSIISFALIGWKLGCLRLIESRGYCPLSLR